MKRLMLNANIHDEAEYVFLRISEMAELRFRTGRISEIGYADEGITKPMVICVNGVRYYRKDSRNTGNSDDIEMLINFIGRYLGVNMAYEERCLTLSGSAEALISRDVVKDDTQHFYSMREVAGFIADLPCVEKSIIDKWRDEYRQLNCLAYPDCKDAFELRASKPTEVAMVIRYGLLASSVLDKAGMIDLGEFRNDYFNMLFLDCLTGQVDRTLGNYGLIYDKQNNHIDFAPLFDNATLKKPYTEDGVCMINGYICDREMVFKELAAYDDFLAIAAKALDKEDQLIGHLKKLSEVFLEESQKKLLFENLETGFKYLSTIFEF